MYKNFSFFSYRLSSNFFALSFRLSLTLTILPLIFFFKKVFQEKKRVDDHSDVGRKVRARDVGP